MKRQFLLVLPVVASSCIDPPSGLPFLADDGGGTFDGSYLDAGRDAARSQNDGGGYDDVPVFPNNRPPPDAGPDASDADDAGVADDASAATDAAADMTAPDAGATEVFFQEGNGYNGTTDTELRRLAPGTNFGELADLEVKGTEGQVILVRWDISSIPTDAVVQSAEIVLYGTADTGGSENDVLAVNTPWAETEATWEVALSGTAWEMPGCFGANDRGPEVLGTVVVTAANAVMPVGPNPDLTARVQAWISSPDVNHGIVLQRADSSNGLHIWSSEAADPAVRPSIRIEYRVP